MEEKYLEQWFGESDCTQLHRHVQLRILIDLVGFVAILIPTAINYWKITIETKDPQLLLL